MFRKLTLASAISFALLPGAAGALGLGGIRAQSALHEPFAGQIELLEVAPGQISKIKVLLASAEEFDKVGAPRPDFLAGLSFTPEVSSQGTPVILVTSREPVREPYLDFLIEVNSPAGRVIKEYTVLLDPPVTLDRPPPQVRQPAIRPPESQQTVRAEPAPGQEPVSAPADAPAYPMRYGPVESGAGLWLIARKMAESSGASVSQTAMALYRNNQEAFVRGDINKLMVGQVLEIPTSAELLALDAGAADREFESALRGDKVTTTPLTDIAATPEADARLKIAGPSEPVPAGKAPSEAPPVDVAGREDAAPGTVGAEAGPSESAAEVGAINREILLTREVAESTRQETEELRVRVRELEVQLADIQRLLKLSNERFAQLQAAGLDQPDGLDVHVLAEEPTEGTVEAEGAPGESADAAAPPTPGATPAETEETGAGEQAEPEPDAAPPFWKSIPQPLLASAVAIPLLLLVLGWAIRKRRKSLEEAPIPGEPTLPSPEVAGGTAAPGEPSAEGTSENIDAAVPKDSRNGEFGNPEDETEEGDIISEADVYIAYGRYREAESLLEEEIGKSPDRLDVKYKLAEAYHGAGNLKGMEAIMSQMQRAGGDRINPDRWKRLEGMLQDLKGADAGGRGRTAAGDEILESAPHDLGQTQDAVFPPPMTPGEALEPSVAKFGYPATRDAPEAATGDTEDWGAQDLELEVDDLDVVSGSLKTPVTEETPEMSVAASDLELKLEDLESLRDVDLANFSDQVSQVNPLSEENLAPASVDLDRSSLEVTPTGKDSMASDVPTSSQWQLDSGMWDEVATKIDLARAYMEMDDSEAARVILEEVAQEGNQEQRAEATDMLEQLG